jgi:hypothetical protein
MGYDDDAIRRGALAFSATSTATRARRQDRLSHRAVRRHARPPLRRDRRLQAQAEAGVAAGVRRVEAVTGAGAGFDPRYEQRLKEIGALVRSGGGTPSSGSKTAQQQKELEREIETLRAGTAKIPELVAENSRSTAPPWWWRKSRRSTPTSSASWPIR